MAHSRLGQRADNIRHYLPLGRPTSGATVSLIELPVHADAADVMALACLDVSTPAHKSSKLACGAAAFDVCLWEQRGEMAPED